MSSASAFLALMMNPLKFRFFLFSKLPSAYFSGVTVKEINEQRCVTAIPYKWFSQNPFRSTYFACLAMAAEMSTGALAMAFIYKRKPSVSMLVVKMEVEYHKKATAHTYFTCEDGILFSNAVTNAIESGEAQTVTATSTGRNAAGELIAEFRITWSFKAKTSKTSAA